MMTNPFVLLLPLLLAVPASAQDPAAPGGQSAPAARIPAAETVTLSFRGGSLGWGVAPHGFHQGSTVGAFRCLHKFLGE